MRYINSQLFRVQLSFQILFFVLFYFFSFGLEIQAIISGILLCTMGIPHGANDHLYRLDKSVSGMMKFLGVYLGTILFYFIVWWLSPLFALILFFIISFHHFGQSNFENNNWRYAPSLFWGIWILAFPALLHFNEAIQIFEQMIQFEKPSYKELVAGNSSFIQIEIWQILLICLLAGIYIFSLYWFEKKNFIPYLLQFIIVSLWYIFTPLLFGFIVVFCLWHAAQSLQHQSSYYQNYSKGTGSKFIKALIPFSLIALFFFALFIHYNGFNISQAFVLLSLITLPHLIVMHGLYEKSNA
jgi:beta-carotene 15,15'-dioxygenase